MTAPPTPATPSPQPCQRDTAPTGLVAQAMAATTDPAAEAERRRSGRTRTVPPERRSRTCFAGWARPEIRAFARYLVGRHGIAETARLCGVSTTTIERWSRQHEGPWGVRP